MRAFLFALITFTAWPFASSKQINAEEIIVLAAASLSSALEEIIKARDKLGTEHRAIRVSYGGTGGLSRQIENGLPAHIFISASRPWTDRLINKKFLDPNLTKDILTNQLALIANKKHISQLEIHPGFPISEALGDGRLAIGDSHSVPAGIYAKQAFEALGCWNDIKHKLAPTKDVRAALRLVELREAELGVVYKTDAAASDDVYIVDIFSPDLHNPIYYTVAMLAHPDAAIARTFFDHLIGETALQTFQKYGFERP